MALVTLDRVAKTYGTAAAPVHALRDVTLTIAAGERVALLGRSGSGKSTLLQLLGGLDRPTTGRISVAGHDLAALSSNGLAAYRQNTVGMIFQAFHLVASRTALENVELPLIFAGRPRRERRATARAALEVVGLGHRLAHRPAELSGGERQRVAIARALVPGPALLLADEPTGNLDSATAAEVMGLVLDRVRAAGMSLILVTHDEDLAGRAADRIVRLADGVLENGRGD
jgi:predicted ABC-type transport system involved in lysophospholipase L1 biosynthesis ATPase subunit